MRGREGHLIGDYCKWPYKVCFDDEMQWPPEWSHQHSEPTLFKLAFNFMKFLLVIVEFDARIWWQFYICGRGGKIGGNIHQCRKIPQNPVLKWYCCVAVLSWVGLVTWDIRSGWCQSDPPSLTAGPVSIIASIMLNRKDEEKGSWIDEWARLHLGCIVPVCWACCGLWMVHIERPVISRGTTQSRSMSICPQCWFGMPWMPTMVPPINTG